MQLDRAFALESAIYHPLRVTPDTYLADAIALLSQTQSSLLPSPLSNQETKVINSCLFVMEGTQLIGLLTQQDAIGLLASGLNLNMVKISDIISKHFISWKQSDISDIFNVINLFQQHNISHIPILNDSDQLLGAIALENIFQVFQPQPLLQMQQVAEVMTTEVIHADMTTSALDLARLMAKHQVGYVAIVGDRSQESEERSQKKGVRSRESGVRRKESGVSSVSPSPHLPISPSPHLPTPVGIVTRQDILRLQNLELDLQSIQAQMIMNSSLFYLRSQDSLSKAFQVMQQRRVKHLLVVGSQGELVGAIAQNNLLRIFEPMKMYRTIERLQQEISQLQAEKERSHNRNIEAKPIQSEQQDIQKKDEKQTTQLSTAISTCDRNVAANENACHQQLQEHLAAVEVARDAIAIVNRDGEYIYLNSAHIRKFGYSNASELLGKTWRKLYYPEQIEWFEHYVFPQLLQNGYWQGETIAKKKDGSTFAEELSLTLLQDGRLICVCRDISSRKQVEEDLRMALEREKELNELKSRFITMTSHEFRTPLTAILGSTELIRHYSHSWTDKKKRLYFDRIQTNVQHMLQILDDILHLGKAEAGKFKFEPQRLDLIQFCRTLMAELQHIPGTKHTLVLAEECKCSDVYMDEQLLRHILGNLLSNAIKYSPNGASVRLAVACQDEKVIFQVEDRGIGIPEDERSHLFESFYRASNVGKVAGTGLGLAIVKKAVDLHGGEIIVNSQVGVGTTFTVTIPMLGEGGWGEGVRGEF